MHVHELPWPQQVLEDLGEEIVRMQATLSYFVEPSPGRRGWTRRHRYASHGLRFDVKRPTETLDQFLQRLSESANPNITLAIKTNGSPSRKRDGPAAFLKDYAVAWHSAISRASMPLPARPGAGSQGRT